MKEREFVGEEGKGKGGYYLISKRDDLSLRLLKLADTQQLISLLNPQSEVDPCKRRRGQRL